jgi:membrane protein DedA with SNARE-associated domain
VPDLNAILAWLTELRPAALLSAMSALAALENVFPPIPADVLVAFGGFISARAGRSPWPAFFVIWAGNMAGAFFTYSLGRRFGSEWIARRLHLGDGKANARLAGLYERYGVAALFVSRFLPGIRSIVPPIAGAMKIPAAGTMTSIALASALWYGLITWLTFKAGGNWETLLASVGRLSKWSGAIAGVLVIVGVGIWFLRRRRQRT